MENKEIEFTHKNLIKIYTILKTKNASKTLKSLLFKNVKKPALNKELRPFKESDAWNQIIFSAPGTGMSYYSNFIKLGYISDDLLLLNKKIIKFNNEIGSINNDLIKINFQSKWDNIIKCLQNLLKKSMFY